MENVLFALIPIFVMFLTQGIKFFLYSLRYGFKKEYILTHGHMPSAHSALAASLVLTVGNLSHFSGGAFVIACALAFIIIDDAWRIRMYLGDQGRYLNMLVDTLKIDQKKYPRLKERVGHRTSEVVVGLICGTVFSLALFWVFQIF